MRRDEIIADIRASRAALEAEGVTHVYLFGSVLHDAAGPQSDIDLLFEHRIPRFNLFDYAHLRQLAGNLLGHEVDFIARSALDPAIRDRVQAEAVRIF